ncbi:cytidine deaminase-like [Rhinoraja longicauda]
MCTPENKSEEAEKLLKKSQEAKGCAYCPHSKNAVGAALLTEDGKTFTGCSVDNATPSLSACAEQVAVWKAVSEGCLKFKSLGVCSDKKDYTPCGGCRQVLREFGDKIDIHMQVDGKPKTVPLAELLPMSSGGEAK